MPRLRAGRWHRRLTVLGYDGWQGLRMGRLQSGRRYQGQLSGTLRLVSAAAVVWLCYRLLGGLWTVFEHAYLNSYYYVGGGQVRDTYWAAVRYAFDGTVTVTALAAALLTFVVANLGRNGRR